MKLLFGLVHQAGALQGFGGGFLTVAAASPLPRREGQIVSDGLNLCSVLFSFKVALPAIVRLTEVYCLKLWVEFFLYCGRVIGLKEVFA